MITTSLRIVTFLTGLLEFLKTLFKAELPLFSNEELSSSNLNDFKILLDKGINSELKNKHKRERHKTKVKTNIMFLWFVILNAEYHRKRVLSRHSYRVGR